MAVSEIWTCPTCANVVSAPFCAACGESAPKPADLTLRGLVHQVVEAVSSVDARLIRSFRDVITHPGRLTAAYLDGRRKPYFLPFQLFLTANVVFFATQSLTTANIFSTPLRAHFTSQVWGSLAERMVTRRLDAVHSTLDRYAPVFDQAVLVNAKSLIILMALAFAALLPVFFIGNRRPFVTHIVFSLHLYTFLLVLFCAALVIAQASVLLGGGGLDSEALDHALSVALLLGCAGYLHGAIRTVYGDGRIGAAVKATGLAIAVGGLVLGYRFILLPITLYTT